MKLISIVTPCYNEQENVEMVYSSVKEVFNKLGKYDYEHIFIDNCSLDNTEKILKNLASKDHRVKIILNNRNFGQIRSTNYALLQARGDAVISLVADMQDPPEMIFKFLEKWEEGYKIVIGVKAKSYDFPIMGMIRRLYYFIIGKLSEIELIKNYTGFGLYDQEVMNVLKKINDPYPYFRGLICDIGHKRCEVPYTQPTRYGGITKNNFYTLYDMAMLGITNHSKIPLRLATMSGFMMAILSLMVAFGYFIYKLIMWDNFSLGMAPVVIGLFFFIAVQLIFIGIIGEYIGSIHTQILNRPMVVERERINFE